MGLGHFMLAMAGGIRITILENLLMNAGSIVKLAEPCGADYQP